MTDVKVSTQNRATRSLASVLGVLVGLAGVEHGILEILQGNVRPESLMIDAIGPGQRLWEFATETALTVIPSFLLSGILSVVLGVALVVWAYAYVDRRMGAPILLVLSVALFLVGGGFAPIFLSVLAFVAATRIRKPLTFWRSRLTHSLRPGVATLWPWTLIVSVVSFVVAVEIAIFGGPILAWVGPETTYLIQFCLGLGMLILAILALPGANAHDAEGLANPAR